MIILVGISDTGGVRPVCRQGQRRVDPQAGVRCRPPSTPARSSARPRFASCPFSGSMRCRRCPKRWRAAIGGSSAGRSSRCWSCPRFSSSSLPGFSAICCPESASRIKRPPCMSWRPGPRGPGPRWCWRGRYAAIVGLSNALPMQVGVARVVFAMGRDRQLPRVLARVHPRHHTPYMGMLVTAALSLGRRPVHGKSARRSGFDRELRGIERIPIPARLGAGVFRSQTALGGVDQALACTGLRYRRGARACSPA